MEEIIINANFLTLPMVGTTRVAIEICRQLIANGVKLSFISPKKIQHTEIAKEFNVKKIGFLSGLLWEQIELPIYLNAYKKSLLISFTNTAPLFYKRNVIAILDIIPLIKPRWTSKKNYLKTLFLVPLLAKNSLAIFTISEYSKKDIVERLKINPEKIKVIYCGVKPLSYLPKANLQSKLPQKQYILAVSSLEPRKNFINVVKAFNLLNDLDILLVLVGPNFSYHIDSLMPFINKEKTIVKGYISDGELAQLYSNATAFVYPSFYEGFGLPPLEAMQYGCPVITSNISSIPEICGDAVLYADPYSPEDISSKIRLLQVDDFLRKVLIAKGFEKVKEYTWIRSTQLLMECLNNLKVNT